MLEDKLEKNEKIILQLEKNWDADEWRRKILLTNKRLIFHRGQKIEGAIPLGEIDEAYPETDWAGSTFMKLKLKDGDEISVEFKCSGFIAFLRTRELGMKQKALINKWVQAINKLRT